MRLYIDGLLFRHTGVGRVYENLLDGFSASEEISSICTLVPTARKREFLERFPSRKIEATFADFAADYREYLFKGFRIRSLKPAPDIYYFPFHNVPYFLGGRVISNVNDVIPITPFFHLPWHVKIRFRIAFSHALERSNRVVCISEFTKSQVLEYFGGNPDHFRVIYPPLVASLVGGAPGTAAGEAPIVEGDYLLYVGNRHIHKNVRCLVEAFARLADEFTGLKLVIAGRRMSARDEVDEALEACAYRDRILMFTEATDRDIDNLYRFAKVFVFPTLIEGFGIPPLEAMAHGIPAVCSDIPVLRESCGDAAIYAKAGDKEDFARAIRNALTVPRGPADVDVGRKRITLFSSEKIVKQYIELFKECLGA